MATYRLGRPLAFTRKNLIYLFAACVVPTHVWSIIILLYELPGWMLRLNVWDLLGVIAYSQVYALAETLLFLAPLLVLNLALAVAAPRPNGFVAHSALVVLLTSVWLGASNNMLESVRVWGALEYLAGLGLYAASVAVAFVAVQRWRRLEGLILAALDRLAVLAFLYLAIDVASLIVVLVRNF